MDSDCFKTHFGDGSFSFDSLVESSGFQNLPHLYYDFNDHISANIPSRGPPIFDCTCCQPQRSNAILLSSGDVITKNNVELAIGGIGSFDQNVDMTIYNNYQQMVMEDSDQYILEHVHVDTSSPQLSASVIRSIEPHKSFPLNSLSSSPQLSAAVIHGIEPDKSFSLNNLSSSPYLSTSVIYSIEPHKSFPLNNLSSLAADHNKLLYDQGANMNSNGVQVKNNGSNTNKKTNVVKGQWTHEEDSMLVRLVEQYGMRRWSHIAKLLNGRIGKQCRERWHNNLRPNIKKDTWSEEEDKILIQAHSEIGNKWAEIAKRLPERTENSIKNHWNAAKRRQLSRRSCRSSKYPKSGSLLQNYIKSITIASTPPTSVLTTEEQNSTYNGEWKGVAASSSMLPMSRTGNVTTDIGHPSNTYRAPAFHFNDDPDLLLEKESMHEMYDDAPLFDQLGCGYMASSSESSKDFEMAMAWDAAIPPLVMPTSSENLKGEMDLMEMITQNSILRSTF